ncbi:hypothetical protein ACFQZI_02230 [Mucilaginibacter lutimaris]|uniref:Uncharacterized protein n=1 Tax=Mucilaginibacter lutimaris TaxID=931629 RepID=A0ABW2ZBZ3_9SPHI
MATSQSKPATTKKATTKSASTANHELETDRPLSEKDEVKNAERKTIKSLKK